MSVNNKEAGDNFKLLVRFQTVCVYLKKYTIYTITPLLFSWMHPRYRLYRSHESKFTPLDKFPNNTKFIFLL